MVFLKREKGSVNYLLIIAIFAVSAIVIWIGVLAYLRSIVEEPMQLNNEIIQEESGGEEEASEDVSEKEVVDFIGVAPVLSMMDKARNLRLVIKNGTASPINILGFYLTSKSYPRDISLQPGQEAPFVLQNITSGKVGDPYTIAFRILYKNLLEPTAQNLESRTVISGVIGEYKPSPEDLINDFMNARLEESRDLALSYLIEDAREEFLGLDSSLVLISNSFVGFEILSQEEVDETNFKFTVRLSGKTTIQDIVEVITVIKLLDEYFISAVELAG